MTIISMKEKALEFEKTAAWLLKMLDAGGDDLVSDSKTIINTFSPASGNHLATAVFGQAQNNAVEVYQLKAGATETQFGSSVVINIDDLDNLIEALLSIKGELAEKQLDATA